MRCPATEVNLQSAAKDMLRPSGDPLGLLQRTYPAAAQVLDGRTIALGGPDAKGGYMVRPGRHCSPRRA